MKTLCVLNSVPNVSLNSFASIGIYFVLISKNIVMRIICD